MTVYGIKGFITKNIERTLRKMPITELLERNARECPNEIALVEVNPEIKEIKRVTWKEYELIETDRESHYRREITWRVFDEKANRFANLLLSRGYARATRSAYC